MRSVDAELFACRQRGGNHRAARMRMRGRVRIVGFIGMRQHPVHHGGFDAAAERRCCRDRRHLFAPLCAAREFHRDASRRQIRARDHGGERVEDMVFRLLHHFSGRARPAASLIYVLSRVVTSLTGAPAVAAHNVPCDNDGNDGNDAAAAKNPPARASAARRVVLRSCFIRFLLPRAYRNILAAPYEAFAIALPLPLLLSPCRPPLKRAPKRASSMLRA